MKSMIIWLGKSAKTSVSQPFKRLGLSFKFEPQRVGLVSADMQTMYLPDRL